MPLSLVVQTPTEFTGDALHKDIRLSYVSGEQIYKDTYGINNSRAFVSASHLFVASL